MIWDSRTRMCGKNILSHALKHKIILDMCKNCGICEIQTHYRSMQIFIGSLTSARKNLVCPVLYHVQLFIEQSQKRMVEVGASCIRLDVRVSI